MSAVRVLTPPGTVVTSPLVAAPGVSSLGGQSIGVLDNGKPNARLLLTTIAERVAARTGATLALVTGKATAAEPAEPEILRQLEAARVVVTGSAD